MVAVVLALVATTVSASYADNGARKRKPKYGVTATAASTNVPLGSAITLTGHVGPNAHGKVVRLQRRVGAGWATVASTTLNTRSNYAVSWRPSTYGTSTLRVLKPAGSGRRAGTSASRAVVVRTVASVAAGDSHTCALITDGTVRCWGLNAHGELGNGSSVPSSPRPVRVAGLTTARQISTSNNATFTCAVVAAGSVWCWGRNAYGLGSGSEQSGVPVRVKGIGNATQVSVGSYSACARLADGDVRCWGSSYYGQLGNGDTTDSAVPVTVATVSDAVQVGVGEEHACAVLSTGAVDCWGYDGDGELGDGAGANNRALPAPVSGISNATAIAAGAYHSCARLSSGNLSCWGDGESGELGNGGMSDQFSPVTTLDVNGRATQVTAGWYFTCTRFTTGAGKCFGYGSGGRLGNGASGTAYSPSPISGGLSFASIAAGDGHACGVLANRAVRCWGDNTNGKLGTGTVGGGSTVPVAVVGLP